MAVSSVYYLDKVILPSSVEFHALGNARLDAGITSMIERGAGEVAPNFIATQMQKPTIPFTTPQLATLLTNVGVNGASIASATLYLKHGATAGRVARATTTHKQVACTTALIYWTTIRLPHNGVGTADVVIVPVYDGTNAPLILTASVALSGTVSAQSYFGAGPVYINNSAVGAVQEITINSGCQLVEVGGESDVYNTFVGVQSVEPSIEVRTFHTINWASGITLTGTALDGTNGVVAYGRKYSADGQRVSNATTEHIRFLQLNGRIIPLDTSGDGSNIVSDRFRVELRENTSSGLALSVASGVAIP